MAWSETKTGGIYNIPIREFICDTKNDVLKLPTNAPHGSSAFCIEEGKVYMITSNGEWKAV